MNRLALVAIVVLAGCAEEEVPTLQCAGRDARAVVHDRSIAQLPGLWPDVAVAQGFDANRVFDPTLRSVTVNLPFGTEDRPHAGLAPIQDGDDWYCPQVAVSATIGGVEVMEETPGGWFCVGPGGLACMRPQMAGTVPTSSGNATLVVADHSRTLELAVGNALAPRTLELVGQPTTMVSAGQPITVRWSPASDLTELTYLEVGLSQGTEHASLETGIVRGVDTLTFTLPAHPGPATLSVELAGRRALDTYNLSVTEVAKLDVTFVP